MLSSILGRAFASSTPSSQQTENTTDIDDTQKFPHLIPISERNVVRHPRKHDETVNGSHSSETTGQNGELKMKERDENLLSTTSPLLTDKLRNMPYSTTTPTVKSTPSSCVSPDSTSDDSDVSSQSKTGISSNHSEFVKTHSSNLSTSINSSPQPTTTTSEETVTELESLVIDEVSQTKDITDDTDLTATEGRGGTIESLSGESPSDIPNDPGKMFIGGLSWITTPESIRSYFSTYGELAEVMVMKDPATRRSRGFGFITFVESGAVEKVMAKTVHTLDGKVIEPKVAVPRKTSHIHTSRNAIKTKKIFVGGISSTTSSDDVKQYFQQFSIVTEVMLAYDKITNRHRGFGFVSFNNDEVVDKICEIHFHEINGKMVESKKALPRDSRFHPMMHPAAAFGMYGFVPPPPHLPPSLHHQIFLPYHPSQNTPPTGAALNQPLFYNNNNTNTTNPFYMGPPFPYHHRFPGGGGSSGAPIPMIPSQYFVAPYAATAGGMAQMSTIGATTTHEEEEKEDNAHSVEQITDELKHLPIPSDTKEVGDRDTLVDQPDSTTDEKTELSIEKKATSSAVR